MKTTLIFLLVSVALISTAEGVCRSFEKDYYEDIGCNVETSDASGCPTSYDCTSLAQRNAAKCYYKGAAYDLDHELPSTPATECLAACKCLNNTAEVQFTCAHIECPEMFRGPPKTGCYRVYEHGKCCMVKEICGEEGEKRNQKFTCEFKDKSYNVGQKFYPEDGTCLKCICQEGFNGSLVEPFCRKISCNLDLVSASRIARGCAPTYYGEKGCCPIGWICPDEVSDKVIPATAKSSSEVMSEKRCTFGKLSLKVGETVSPIDQTAGHVTCTCNVPPHPVCIQKPSEAPAV